MNTSRPLSAGLAALCLLLPSCEGLDPALLGAPSGGGGYNRPAPRYDDRPYDRGYSRPAERPYSQDYGRPDYRDDRYGNSPYDSRPYDSSRNDHPQHSSNKDRDYFGGPKEWYKSGYGLGKKDRREGRSSDYRRHKSQYDGKTQGQFSNGYSDGYNR